MPYQDPKLWRTMTVDERELLGKLFVLQGKDKLKKGDKSALKTFNLATKAAPKSAKIFFQKGLAYFNHNHSHNPRFLLSACRAFEKATQLKENYADAWYKWANTLLLLGKIHSDVEILQDALNKFEYANALIPDSKKRIKASFYWNWGHCWHVLGKISGEAVDISHALSYYKKADSLGLDVKNFWIDYGNAFAEQATLLGKGELFIEVVEMFYKAVDWDPNDFEAWFSIACSYMRVYENDYDEDYFFESDDAFERAAEIFSNSSSLWLCWGQLTLTAGKITQDMDRVFESSIKFAEANEREPNHPIVLCHWAEALMHLGAYHENYRLIAEAEEKIRLSVEINPLNSESWYFYGRCYVEMGRYFQDASYYNKALEKYQHGFSLNPTLKLFHYGIAVAFFELFEITCDENALNQSLKHYSLLEDELDNLPPQFWLDWGNALYKFGEHTSQRHYIENSLIKYEKAIALLGSDVEDQPILVETIYYYSIALDSLGSIHEEPTFYEKAIQLLSCLLNSAPNLISVRYQLALTYSNLGELTSDVDSLEKSHENFEIILNQDPENESAWNDWGITILNLANLLNDPSNVEYVSQLYGMAETKFHQAIALGNIYTHYNMAGYYSLIGDNRTSMISLERAHYLNALPTVDDIMHDEWLYGVRNTDEFKIFFSKLLSNKI